MSLNTTYATKDVLDPFWFKSPQCYPDVLVLWVNKQPLWAVSSDPKNTPMSGLNVETHPGDSVPVPKRIQVIDVGYSDWYLTANESTTQGVQILSVLFADTVTTFQHLIDIDVDGELLKTPYNVDDNPKHAVIPKGSCREGELVFSGTNFRLYPYITPSGAALLACIDVCRGTKHPAWIIDRGSQTLFLPNYAVNRPIPARFDTVCRDLTERQVNWIILGSILLFIALLFILPVTRYIILNGLDWGVNQLAGIVPIRGISAPLAPEIIDHVTQITRQLPYAPQVVYDEVRGGII